MFRYVEDYASDKVPILKVPLPSLDIEPEPPGLGPITSTVAKTPAQTPAESPEPPLTQEESELLDARAFSHRATGKTYRQIARKLNIPSSSAYKRVQREMERRREEFAEDEADSRELIVALLDGALEAIATQAYDGDQKAFHLLLQYANTRVRLAKIENPKSPDKLIRKINAAATAYEASAADDNAEEPQHECNLEPVETNQTCEESKGAKSEKGGEPGCGQDREQDRGQRCGQESQPLAETHVATDEKICAEPVDAHQEGLTQSAQSPSHVAPQESAVAHPVERGQEYEQDCGQESQPLAETQVAADENICAERVDSHHENINECGAISHEVPGGENINTLVSPSGAIQRCT